MAQTMNIDQIVNQIALLDYNNKINILAKVISMIKSNETIKKSESITNLKGLGKDIWVNIDTDTYLETERESWE
jgi:hypothetical protein